MLQHWEYCSLRHQGNKAILDYCALGSMVGYKSEAAGRFTLVMARLGTAEWDLVAVSSGGTYFFTRAIQPGRRIDDAF
jgi:hypothetical protein